jgi:hypothetical protein
VLEPLSHYLFILDNQLNLGTLLGDCSTFVPVCVFQLADLVLVHPDFFVGILKFFSKYPQVFFRLENALPFFRALFLLKAAKFLLDCSLDLQ